MKMELQILDWIQQMRTPVGDVWMVFISRLGNAGMIWILFTCLLLMIPRTRRWGAALAVALCLDAIICNILLKPMVCRIRPCDVNQTVQLIIARPADYSFPSGHTAASFAAVAALYFAGAKKWWKITLPLAILMAFSRMYLYVHYPTDILGGILVGILCGVIAYLITKKKLKFGSAESMEGVKNAETVKKAEQKRHFYNRFFQKKRYKDAYRAARAGKSVGSLGGATTIAGVENMTVKAKIALKEIIKRNRAMFAGIGIFALLFLVIAVSLGSCSASIEGAGSVIGITTYPSSDEDIYAAENQYAALESALNQQINEMERRHPNYDEYQYNIAEIGHNPYHLISYLTAKYGDWTYSDVENELQSLFEAQYHLNTEGRTETVTETRNVRVGESLGQVVTSGYCNCRICCGVWSGGPTASGAYPTANHTIAVDASNPFVPIGTKVVMNGVEYTVEDTGAFARYGVQFDVYYDNHAAASAHGHQTWEAYIADDNGSQEVTVTSTSTKKILYVTLTNGSFDAVARANLNAEQLIIYNALNTTYGNRNYLWDVKNVSIQSMRFHRKHCRMKNSPG